MAHPVICVYCKTRFDRDKIPSVQVSKARYAHVECHEKEQDKILEESSDKELLEKYIMKLFGEDYVNARIRKQIKDYMKDYNFTYSGIYKALLYFFEVKGNPIEKANGGIGIVPFIYKDAYNYYYSIWLANQKNENKKINEYVPKEITVHIPVPERNVKKRKLFTFLDEEEIDGE